MKRRTLPTTALAATAALLLTGCGSGDDKAGGKDNIASTSPSPRTDVSAPVDRPEITFPKDVENMFERWKTGNATEDAVLADVAQTVNAVDDAILQGDANSSTVAYYRQGQALLSAQQWIQAWLDEGLTWTGVTRYFAPNVKVADKNTAAVTYCADESKAYNKDRKTGKVDRSPSDESPYVAYSVQLRRSSKGVWQTTEVQSKRGDRTCAY
ncbi:hypothetical protein GA0115233_1003105 [Streptomyces sp. DI166]|uniref:hypothetical protein n=1 Tax=unclassified Streptomyces TaxID=2593676 RepID=UPI0007F48120|nr:MULTISPECIES: hypothetical protein [unclassified Streptomyces]SBT88583.1 hypothetical protein GA0115233_1003105 [Streptomyces sp. DI166]